MLRILEQISALAIMLLVGMSTTVAAQEQLPMNALPVYTTSSEQLEDLLDRAIAFEQHHCDEYHEGVLFKVQIRTDNISGQPRLRIAASDFAVSTSNIFGVLQHRAHYVLLEGEVDFEDFFDATDQTADLSGYLLEEGIGPVPGGSFTEWYYFYSGNGFTLLKRNAFCKRKQS